MSKPPFSRESIEKLQKLMMTVIASPKIAALMFEILDQSDLDRFSKALVEFSLASDSIFKLLTYTIESEFERNKTTPASILRGNTAATKLMTLFCRHAGLEYLQGTLSHLVVELITDPAVDLEVDPAKKGVEDDDPSLAEGREQLRCWIERFIGSITSPEAVELLPGSIKALCFCILQQARKYGVDNVVALVGGFIMLRFVNPSLISPETYGICKLSDHTKVSRRHLTLITKALQNVSNQREFNESFMIPLNEFLMSQVPLLESYLKAVCIDTRAEDQALAFADILVANDPQPFDVDLVDLAHWKFFHEFVTDEQQAILQSVMDFDEEFRETREFKAFMEEMAEFGEEGEEKPSALELFYSPLCPFSRMVWLFCLENNIDVKLHKVDLLKKDQALDITFKKFRGYSKSLKTPLLVDGDVVVEESNVILVYLCEKFFLNGAWYPFGNLPKRLEIHQTLNWMEREVHPAVVGIWNFAKNLSVSTSTGPNEDDHIFLAMSKLNAVIESSPYRGKYAFGADKSLVDLAITVIDAFCQVHYGYASTSYPALHGISTEYQKSVRKHWGAVNSEFQGFAQYVMSVAKKDSLPKVVHTVFFQDTPPTVYEVVLDPENDIFLFLASKTISTKTNAKVKMGLKKLNATEKEDTEAQEKEKVPYIISLEVGGKFNIHRREGTNLVLVPGNMIVQESSRKDWPVGHRSTEIFELHASRESRCKLVFTQMNCPIKNMRESEELWEKFWRKVNGTRTKDLHHVVSFRGKPIAEVFGTFADVAKFAKQTKTKVKEEDGLLFMHNKAVVAKYLSRQNDEQIVQDWRCVDWVEDHWSVCTLTFTSVEEIGTRVSMLLTDVPIERAKSVEKIWKENVWKKLGGVICGDIHQRVVFREAPDALFQLLTTQAELEPKMRPKCMAFGQVGEPFHFLNGVLKGTVVQRVPGELLVFTLAHKDWATGHQSIVTAKFQPDPLGTLAEFSHDMVPQSKVKAMDQIWATEFWDRLGAVQVDDIHASVMLNSSPAEVFKVLTSSEEMSAVTSTDCEIGQSAEEDVMLYSKMLKGKVVNVVTNYRIVWNLRAFEWPYGHSSEVTFELAEHNAGKGTLLMYCQKNLPLMGVSDAQDRWETMAKGLKKHCTK